ncbi:MAG: MXAN_5808 family serine peptidase [Bradymonadaceae bacterium]
MTKVLEYVQKRGRYVVALIALAIAFALSIQFSDRGVQFDLDETAVSAAESGTKKKGDYQLSELKILNRALLQIKDNYVEPERVKPAEMLAAALDKVQSALPAVVVDFQPDKKNPETLEVSVEDKSKSFEVAQLESLWEMSFRLKEVFGFIEKHTTPEGEDQTFRDIEYAAINGMLSILDPHSTLLSPEHYKEMQTQTGGEFGGLGIVISIRDGQLTVISPIDGTPASGKGIKAKDKIVRIEDESTINMKLQEAVSMLRGEPGTDIDIWIDRKGWSEPRKFTITRDVIEIKSVNSEPLDDKVGYVRIKSFQANTYSDLKKHLKKLKKKMGGMDGLVLDLRDNPGGLLDQAIKVSDMFLKDGVIVSTVGAGNKMRDKKVATKSGTEPSYPIMVLVNAGSASASEIVSGALQNHDRALVLGDTTFGKGTVQVLYEFPDKSALKLTVAQYLTPGGVSIQSRGITPDLRMIPATITKDKVNMFLSENILREGDLASHLSNQAAGIAKKEGVVFLRYLKEQMSKEDKKFRDPNAFREDFQINLSQRLLSAAKSRSKRPKLLETLQPELKKVYSKELGVIQKKLSEYDVDWSAGPSPDKADIGFEASTSQHNGEVIEGGEKIKLTGKLTNNGDEPLYRMKAISQSENSVLDDHEFIFGKVEPGETKSWSVDVEIPKDTKTRHDMVKFKITDENRQYGEPREQPVAIKGLERPKFAFSYEIDDASGDGVLQVDEEVTFRVFVENVGKADSAETLAYLKDVSDDSVYLETGRIKIDGLPAGETKPVDFKFRLKDKPKDGCVELKIDVYDETFREFSQKTIEIPFSGGKGNVTKAGGKATVTQGPTKIFAGADTASNVLARAEKSAEFPVVAKMDKWLKVNLGRQVGWLQQSYADYAEDASASPATSKLTWTSFRAPTLALEPGQRITDAKKVELSGEITDNTAVKDYYIYVYHREDASNVESRKIDYERGGQATVDVAKQIPLFDGMNRISIVARDDEEMSMQENVFVYRK